MGLKDLIEKGLVERKRKEVEMATAEQREKQRLAAEEKKAAERVIAKLPEVIAKALKEGVQGFRVMKIGKIDKLSQLSGVAKAVYDFLVNEGLESRVTIKIDDSARGITSPENELYLKLE